MLLKEFKITLAGKEISLRPTLRCACILDQRYNGFEPLARSILDGSLHVIVT